MISECGSETSRLAGELLELQGRWSETEAMLTAVKDSHSVKVSKLEVTIGELERDLGKTASSLLKEKKARKAKSSEISAFLGSLECIRNRDLALATIEGGMAVVQSFESETPPILEAEEARLSGCKGDLAVADGDFDLILADLKSACFLSTCSEGPEGKDPVLGGDAAPGLDEATGEEGAFSARYRLRGISEDVKYKHRGMVLGSRIFWISCLEMLETSALGLGKDLGELERDLGKTASSLLKEKKARKAKSSEVRRLQRRIEGDAGLVSRGIREAKDALRSVFQACLAKISASLGSLECIRNMDLALATIEGGMAVVQSFQIVDGDFDLILAELKSACFLLTCSEGPEGKDPVLGGDAAPGYEATSEEGASLLKEKKARKAKSSEVRCLQRQIEDDAGLASRGIREAKDALRSEFQARLAKISAFLGSLECIRNRDLALATIEGGMAVVQSFQSETPPTLEAEEARLSGCKGDLAVVDGDFDLILADLKSACFLPTCSEGPEGEDPVLGGEAAPGLDEATGEEGA
ncbi:hypothetical protein F2Q69_00058579 [Brassica cretica]|uniref:Uncharacterized protein n=2 Tax=Brassica cretica TaxID=69181 RepID=A0A8S9RHV0_BRACR|nr:hypothetical protein F2Q69_00058579 [Brassica cretica]